MSIVATTLSANMLIDATTASVRDVIGFASSSESSDLVQIGSEFLLVSGGLGTTSWSSITRAYAGSTAAAHTSADPVYRIVRGWTDLVRVKRALDIADTDDDAHLLTLIDAADAELTQRVGMFLGPAYDTVRAYDGCRAVDDGRRLWIPGGIRTLTQVRIADSAGTWTTATLADFLLRPNAFEMRAGEPYRYIEIKPYPAGAYSRFPTGMGDVELTGTFGRADVVGNAAAIADMLVARMWQDRDREFLSAPTPSKFLYPDDLRTLAALKAEHFALAG